MISITAPLWLIVLGVLLLVLLVAIGMWAAGLAQRLHRLHIRTDAARINLEGALEARAAVIAALQPDLAPMAASLHTVALRARDMSARSAKENALLREMTASTVQHPSFVDASSRVDYSSRFYNDAVADTRALRARWAVSVLRLAGNAPLPEYYEARALGEVE